MLKLNVLQYYLHVSRIAVVYIGSHFIIILLLRAQALYI